MKRLRRLPGARRAAVWGAVVATLVTLLALFASAGPAGAAPDPPLPGTPAAGEQTGPPDAQREKLEREAREQEDQRHERKLRDQEDREADIKEKAREQEDEDKKAARQDKRAKQKKFQRQVDTYREYLGDQHGVLSAFQVADRHGIPITAYDPILDTGSLTDVQSKIQGAAATFLFTFTTWTVAFACWLIAWALSWSLASIFLTPAEEISHALYSRSVMQLGIPTLALAFSGVVAVWHIFFGRRQRGWGEILASTLISALAASSLIAPPSMLLSEQVGAVGQARALGLTVAAIVMDNEHALQDATDAKALTRPITDKLADTFVVQPSMLISYGQVFKGDCARLYSDSRLAQAVWDKQVDKAGDEIFGKLKSGSINLDPGVGAGPNRWLMDKAVDLVMDQTGTKEPSTLFEEQCVDGDAAQAKKASWDKAFGALFILIAALLVAVLLSGLAVSYLAAQGVLAAEAAFLRIVLVLGIMPGPGRSLLWERGVNILRTLGLLIALVVMLAVSIVVIDSVLGASGRLIPGGLTVRFAVIDLIVIAAIKWRKKLLAKSRGLAAGARARMSSTPLGGSAPAQLDHGPASKGGSKLAKLATAGLMIGTLAATGGTAAALGGSAGRGALGARLTARGLRGGARLAGKATAGTARAAWKTGRAGLRYTAGAPVTIPRTGRALVSRLQAAPASAAALHNRAAGLQDRINSAWHSPARQQWRAEWTHHTGIRSLGNKIRAHRGLPPTPRPNDRRFLPPRPRRTPTPTAASAAAPAPSAPSAAAPVRTAAPRPRRAPYAPTPPASSAQAALRQARARSRPRTPATPPPRPGHAAAAPPVTPPHPGRAGRNGGGRGRGGRP